MGLSIGRKRKNQQPKKKRILKRNEGIAKARSRVRKEALEQKTGLGKEPFSLCTPGKGLERWVRGRSQHLGSDTLAHWAVGGEGG